MCTREGIDVEDVPESVWKYQRTVVTIERTFQNPDSGRVHVACWKKHPGLTNMSVH